MGDYIDSKHLDPQTRDRLHNTLKKGEGELTDFDKDFLRARGDYIKDKHKELFPSVFGKKGAKEAKKRAEQAQEQGSPVEDPKPENPFEETQTNEEEELLG